MNRRIAKKILKFYYRINQAGCHYRQATWRIAEAKRKLPALNIEFKLAFELSNYSSARADFSHYRRRIGLDGQQGQEIRHVEDQGSQEEASD